VGNKVCDRSGKIAEAFPSVVSPLSRSFSGQGRWFFIARNSFFSKSSAPAQKRTVFAAKRA
jgi:hypothetical protein